MSFAESFVWGAAASSYQIEGAAFEDGKGPSVWDIHCQKPGAIFRGESGLVACDHYNRYTEDIDLMSTIGLQAYRFSISWPRVLPMGVGDVNTKGLDFYDRLVDALLEKNIQPYVTLYHWDMPHELFCRGGWLNRCSADWFAEYTKVVVNKLSDRVHHWMTFNEPQVFVECGYHNGAHAPGLKYDISELTRLAHHVLLAHGKSVRVIRDEAGESAQVGFVVAPVNSVPMDESVANIEAARMEMFAVHDNDLWTNGWWLDPIFLGRYPDDGSVFGGRMHDFTADDMDIISHPIDFLGVNIYYGNFFQQGECGKPQQVAFNPGFPTTALNWYVVPEAMYWTPRFLFDRYKMPMYIMENGLSCRDWVSQDGRVHDSNRIDFMTRYLQGLHRASEDGVDMRGYFYWSIMDNFEWAQGYKERFGLIHVDFSTLKRTLKDSALFYKEVIASRGANIQLS
ncbi:MAG: GH1 family beta-glucosidase [Chitinivibrionales bacterium]